MYDAYNTIENHEYIPKEAFLYFPIGSSTARQEDDFKIILNNEVKRLIYEGGIDYLPEEMEKINKFKENLKKKQIFLDKRWSKTYIYKFLQSTGCDYKRTQSQILAHNEYKAQLNSQGFQNIKKFAEPFLKQGPFYFNGRDAKFRPIIVCDIAKVVEMKMTSEQINKALQFFFEFMYQNMFINGQVQNVVGIIDVGFMSPMDLVKPMKTTLSFIQGNYKYKLHAVYIIRSTSMFQFFYGIAKHLLKEDTLRKICVIEKGEPIKKLLAATNLSQLQQRFGGTHPNLKNGDFWPPQQFSSDFSHPEVKRNIISQQQYQELFRNGLLPGRKVCLSLIQDELQDPNEVLVINDSKTTQTNFRISGAKMTQKKERNIFQKVMHRITCYGCFGTDQGGLRKNKRNIDE